MQLIPCALLEVSYVRIELFFFFSSRRRHTRSLCDWSSDVCSSDLPDLVGAGARQRGVLHGELVAEGAAVGEAVAHHLDGGDLGAGGGVSAAAAAACGQQAGRGQSGREDSITICQDGISVKCYE